jgi:hemolysin activation/secretion protein
MGKRTLKTLKATAFAAAALSVTMPAVHAQAAPDAGRLLQETAPVLQAPKPSPALGITLPALTESLPGGAQVQLKSVRLSGNTRFTEIQLLAVLGQAIGQAYDLAGLKDLTNRISEHYRQSGYPFARAYLPPQPMTDGALRIDVVEGRYGQVKANIAKDAALQARAQAFLAPLQSGSVIESVPLERLTLILDDQPGIKVAPIIRPGQEIGTGDLEVNIERSASVTGDAGADNQGNRYTGRDRLRFNLNINSPLILGDQITLRSLLSQQGMWLGTLGYSLPLGAAGVRGNVSYSHTYYELGGSFANSMQSGTADVTSVGLSYPTLRSQSANVTLSGSWQDKLLHDKNGLAGTEAKKSSTTVPLTLSFDVRDGMGSGGITYGSLAWTLGQLQLDSALMLGDLQAKTEGSFNKVNLDLARVQAINNSVTLFGRLSVQSASKNLDSSEDFGLGGANGVRAYPSGEGFGDEGWLAQLELRYVAGPYAPYVFYDAGSIKTNAKPWQTVANERTLAGAGIGLRYQRTSWNLDVVLAWRTEGGKPESDMQDQRERGPQALLSVGYKF